jgi:23S rRNA pseudouridine2605 synthase
MAEASGMLVTRLRRIQEGTLSLGELPKGNWRFLTKNEISQLQNL